jgi:UDP-glucose 4-epimerase
MRVAVTGGGGFIGSHVVDQLAAAGHEVRVIDTGPAWRNPAAAYADADIFDAAALDAALAGCQAVFHLAAISDVNVIAEEPATAVRVNVEGVARVLDAARRTGCARFILASTVWVYGASAAGAELSEEAPVDLRRAGHVYVSTKLAAEMLVHSYREMYGQQFTILRYGIPYGPRMREALVIARFVRCALDGRPITIAGTGDQQRNYVYVSDLADAHVRALAPAAEGRTITLEGGTPVSVREIADAVRELVADVPVRLVPARPADFQGVSGPGRLAKELLDWSPVTSFGEGVRRYLAWLGETSGARPSVTARLSGTAGSVGDEQDEREVPS